MYDLLESESLIEKTDYVLEREDKRHILFQVSEILAPDVVEKYVVAPSQPINIERPKDEFIVRNSDRTAAINEFLARARRTQKSSEMFEQKKPG